jgi:hypothetical protein
MTILSCCVLRLAGFVCVALVALLFAVFLVAVGCFCVVYCLLFMCSLLLVVIWF